MKASRIFWILVTIIPVAGIIFSLSDPKEFQASQELWRERIGVFGAAGPFAFVALQALQVIITPISHYVVGVAGGFLYGPYLGGFLNWVGRMVGHCTAYYLARRFGRRFLERFVDPQTISKYDHIVSGSSKGALQPFILFLIYYLPFFPDDEISYLVGLSTMNFRVFLLANIFGQIGGSLGLAYIGSGTASWDAVFWALMLFSLFGFPLLWFLFRKQKRASLR